ncbi:hypothetical protein ZYGR_0AI07710 [Zygosaccharomyces rouxii]|uniref:LAA1-like C-terminal TPR repeats domain-containing protein n=1 Tax=Zygosaccharomyces rouxii TaxID=4956 RepID=A0A1Q3ACM9_ZYGRO|nr:hypothetical protein ZYGR_0AI07710 [Zygosaccharomyces rouxii]
MPDFSLVEIISKSERKRHTLLSWVSDNFDKLYKGQNYEKRDEYTKRLLEVNNNLEQLVRYLANAEEEKTIDSHYVFIRVAQLYTFCLTRLENAYTGRIYDASELLANVLAEEPIEFEMEKNANEKDKKKKKSNPKKTYVFSPIKDLACTVLTQFFESFGNRISALGPLISGSAFKNIKKMLEKTKYIHATYMTSILQLHAAILKNTKNMSSSNTFYGKFAKLSKIIIESIQVDQEDYPVDFLSSIIEIWSIYMRQDQFIKDHGNNLKIALCTKFNEKEWGIFGLVNDHTRIHTARSIAEVLFHFFNARKLITLSQVWEIYAEIFCQNLPRELQAGCFESIIHFIGLCSATDSNFFGGTNYLEIIRSLSGAIFDRPDAENRNMETSSRYLRYFEHMHDILLPRVWDSSKSQILFRIMGCTEEQENGDSKPGEKFRFAINGTLKNQWLTLTQLELVRRLLCVLSSSFGNEQHIVKQIKQKLIELSTCDTFIVRIHSVEIFKTFLKSFPEYLTETIESQLTGLSKDFELEERFHFSVNHGRSLLIASLVECADKDYVSYELIMRITIFATSFIKNHTTSTNSSMYYKGLICWILLIGLVNYKDEQYLSMQSSQLFLFWKVLLTHTFTHQNEDELYKNLEIRNHALVCLLTYLGNITIQKDIAKQVSYLLTKCSNYNHSVTVKSNSIDKALLVNEYRLLQVYLRINEFIKKDFNSSLLILIVKNFSDPNLYGESVSPGLDAIKKAGTKKPSKDDSREDVIMRPSVNTLLCQNDGFAFGLSSKILSSAVTELTIKSPKAPGFEVGQNTFSRNYYWYQPFEDEITKPILPILCLDYLIMLYGSSGYSGKDRYGPRITTSLIDSSMEIFSLIFPYLNAKIQYSVIESLNLSMFSKLTTPLRSIAIATNSVVAIHGALKIIQDKELSLDISVGQLLMESVKKIDFHDDPFLTYLKAESIGLITAAVSRGTSGKAIPEYVLEQSNIIIKNVVDLNDPYLRVLHALSLSAIFKYNSQTAKFHSLFDVIFTLLKDPHPVVHGWSLKALHVILKKHQSMDILLASELLRTLEDIAMDPNFGTYGSSIIRYNHGKEFDSHIILGQIFCTLTETIGPSIPDLDKTAKEAFRNVTFGCITTNDVASESLGLAIYENIATFKLSGILCDEVFIGLAMDMIGGSFITGFGASYFNSHFTETDEVIPFTTSMKATFDSFRLFTQMIRLQKGDMFLKNMDTQSWRYLTLYPNSPHIIDYFFAWLEQSYKNDTHWFEKLCVMFNMTRGKLFRSIFQRVDKILEEKGIKKVEEKQIRGEEEVSITNSSEKTTKGALLEGSETICWLAKISILRLLFYLCEQVQHDEESSHIIAKQVPSLIRISFQASTTRVASMKSMGLKILNILLKQHTRMNNTQENLMIEQQEAQITSALMPAFSEGSSPDNVASAINVAAEFLGSNIAPLERMSRISQLLVTLLGTFNDKSSDIKVGETTIITQRARRKVELAILNAWAWLVYSSLSTKNDDLFVFVKGYLDVVVPLWIISLREYVMVKYEGVKTEEELEEDPRGCLIESQNTKLELYKPVWLNFVVALGSLMEADKKYICKCLNADEMESFMFILFAQCMETTVKNIDDHSTKMKVLPALHNILKNSLPINNIFEDDIHSEFVGILDRLMIMGDNSERILLIYIINDLVVGYTKQNKSHESFLEGIDKLYELLRLLLIPVGTILPFIKASGAEAESADKINVTDSDLSVLKLTFGVFESNVSQFDELFKVDLYACLLFIMARIYKSDVADSVVVTILPLLKSLTKGLIGDDEHVDMLDVFYGSIRDVIGVNLNKQNQLATMLILLSNGYQGFDRKTLEEFSDLLVDGIRRQETQAISVQGFKTIINLSQRYEYSAFVLNKAIKNLSLSLKDEKSATMHRLALEILGVLTNKIVEEKPDRVVSVITLILLFILSSCRACPEVREAAGDKVVSIIKLDFSAFKSAINNELNQDQKQRIEMIIQQSSEYQSIERSPEGSNLLELRYFN